MANRMGFGSHSVTAAGTVPDLHRVPCTSAVQRKRLTTNATIALILTLVTSLSSVLSIASNKRRRCYDCRSSRAANFTSGSFLHMERRLEIHRLCYDREVKLCAIRRIADLKSECRNWGIR
jgi:hypothetical protein